MRIKTEKLGNYIDQIRGVSYSGDEGIDMPLKSYLPVLRANNIIKGELVFNNLIYIPERRISEVQLIKEGDIVIAASSGSKDVVGKAAMAKSNWQGSFGAFCKVIRPKSSINKKYLSFFFETQYYRNTISSVVNGANINNIRNEHIDELEIRLPSPDYQEHIAAILTEADALRKADAHLINKYDQLLQASFLQLFGSEKEMVKKFPSKKLELTSDVVSGVTKNTKGFKNDFIEVPYMRVANVQDGHINLNEVKTIKISQQDSEKYLLKRNDILLTEGGDPDKLGRGAVWHNEISPCIHQNHIFRVRANEKELNPVYLSFHIGSSYGKRYFLKAAKQTTGIASINISQLKNFDVLIPPLSLQNKFAEITAVIMEQKSISKQQQKQSENLFQGLLHKAFNGEL